MKLETFSKMSGGATFGRWARWAALSVLTSCAAPPRATGLHPVGVLTLWATDPVQKKPMAVEIWYPAAVGTKEQKLLYAGIYPGLAARDAAAAEHAPPGPLIVVGHGLKSSRFDMSWLAEALASDGMIVAAVDHPGTCADSWDEIEAVKMWHRAQQLSAVIDTLLASAAYGNRIDARRIGALGHSAGGSAVLLLAGAEINPELFAARYPASAPAPEGLGPDARVQAVIALAPGTGRVFDAAGLQKMRQPALICSGTADWETPDAHNAAFYHQALPRSTWHSLPGAGHYTFKPVCNFYGKVRSRALCLDGWHVDRSAVHNQVVAWSRSFLADNLR